VIVCIESEISESRACLNHRELRQLEAMYPMQGKPVASANVARGNAISDFLSARCVRNSTGIACMISTVDLR
jgi:hypothetical protein